MKWKELYNKRSFSKYWKKNRLLAIIYTLFIILSIHVTFYLRKVYIRGELLSTEEPYSRPRVP